MKRELETSSDKRNTLIDAYLDNMYDKNINNFFMENINLTEITNSKCTPDISLVWEKIY